MARSLNSNTVSMNADLSVSNPLVKAFLHYAASLRLDMSLVLEPLGYTFDSFSDVDKKTPEIVYDLIFSGADQLANDVHLGLRFGCLFSLQHIGILGYLMMNCQTFEQSLESYERFQNGLGETIAIRHSVVGTDVVFQVDTFGGEKSGRHRLEAFISSFVVSGVQLTGRPLKIYNCVTPFGTVGDSKFYESAWGCAPEKGDRVTFSLDKSYLTHVVINSIPELFSTFERNLIQSENSEIKNPVSQRVRKEVLGRIGKEQMGSLGAVAKALGVSARTLQIKLEQEGLSFREILEECQLDFAKRFLRSGSPIAEISYALGFSEPSAFQRAFKRWAGQTPAQYRDLSMGT